MFTTYLRIYLNLFLLRIGPQDIPRSKGLFWVTLGTLIGSGLIQGSYHYSADRNLFANLLYAALINLFVVLILEFKGYSNRYLQTATATFGIFSCFYIMHIFPAFLLTGGEFAADHTFLIILIMLRWILFIYGIVVFGHILQHAISTSKGFGLLLSVIFYTINFVLVRILFATSN